MCVYMYQIGMQIYSPLLTYSSVIPCSSVTCSLYMSSAVCKLVVLSPALKTETSVVFFNEFGCSMLQSWRLNLKLPRPLSPPSLIHNSFEGILPLCQVRPVDALMHVYYHLMPCRCMYEVHINLLVFLNGVRY